jgi:hypothetical protein
MNIENIKNITHALQSLRPGAQWVLNGETYEGIVWHDTVQTKPSIIEVHTEIDRLQADYDSKEYQRQRAVEYPPIGDQLDALWKGGDAAAAMLAQIQAVKNQFPKP